MKVLCSVCEASEAKLICCADEAALCLGCDQKIHAANKLAGKHQRVALSEASSPKCDICQEAVGYFLCVEDRALLCQNCDVAIHTMNNLVSSHQRFLLTGVQASLEAAEPGTSTTSKEESHFGTKTSEFSPHSMTSSLVPPRPVDNLSSKTLAARVASARENVSGQMSTSKTTSNEVKGSLHSQVNEFFGATNIFSQRYNYNYMAPTSAKAVYQKLAVVHADEFLSRVPESTWISPEAEFSFPSETHHDGAGFVPELPSTYLLDTQMYQPLGFSAKRPRQSYSSFSASALQ